MPVIITGRLISVLRVILSVVLYPFRTGRLVVSTRKALYMYDLPLYPPKVDGVCEEEEKALSDPLPLILRWKRFPSQRSAHFRSCRFCIPTEAILLPLPASNSANNDDSNQNQQKTEQDSLATRVRVATAMVVPRQGSSLCMFTDEGDVLRKQQVTSSMVTGLVRDACCTFCVVFRICMSVYTCSLVQSKYRGVYDEYGWCTREGPRLFFLHTPLHDTHTCVLLFVV